MRKSTPEFLSFSQLSSRPNGCVPILIFNDNLSIALAILIFSESCAHLYMIFCLRALLTFVPSGIRASDHKVCDARKSFWDWYVKFIRVCLRLTTEVTVGVRRIGSRRNILSIMVQDGELRIVC